MFLPGLGGGLCQSLRPGGEIKLDLYRVRDLENTTRRQHNLSLMEEDSVSYNKEGEFRVEEKGAR